MNSYSKNHYASEKNASHILISEENLIYMMKPLLWKAWESWWVESLIVRTFSKRAAADTESIK